MTEQTHPRDVVFDVQALGRNLGDRTRRSAVTVIIFVVLKTALGLVTVGALARLVAPAEHGIIALAIPFATIFAGLSEFGLAQAIIQRPTIGHLTASALLWIGTAIGLVLTLLVAGLGLPVAEFYGRPELTLLLAAVAPYILLSAINSQYVAILRRQMQIKKIEWASFLSATIAGLIAIAAAWWGAGYWALALQLVLMEAVNMVLLVCAARWLPATPWHARYDQARSALGFGGTLALERVLAELLRNAPIVAAGRIFSSLDAGFVYRAQFLALMPQRRLVAPLSGAFVPALSRLQDQPEAFRRMYTQQMKRGNLLMGVIGLTIISCADVLVSIVLGPGWEPAIPLLAVMGVIPLTSIAIAGLSWALVASGQGAQLLRFRLSSIVLVVAALAVGSRYGLTGFVGFYVLAQTLGLILLLSFFTVRATPIDGKLIVRVLGAEGMFVTLLALAMLAARAALGLAPIVEAALVLCAMGLAYLIRAALDAELRDDLRKLLPAQRGKG